MFKQITGLIIISVLFLVPETCFAQQLDAAQDGPIYGDPEGLARVAKLEQQLHNMHIREDHPRIFVTKETLPIYQQRVQNGHPSWLEVKNLADKGDMINAAFAYLMLKDSDPAQAMHYANIAIQKLKEMNPEPWNPWPGVGEARKTGLMALAFDWVYDAMSDTDRTILINKIGQLSNITGRAQWIRKGNREAGSTFHREEWLYFAWRAWPEIALAHHYPDAEFCYKSRWNYDWYWGDAARMYAYVADGTPFEGYYNGADGASWFLALKSATGINLIDDPQYSWFTKASDYLLYRTDFGKGREIFHRGVAHGAGGLISYVTDKEKREWYGATFPLTATKNPYSQWIVKNISGVSPWLISDEYQRHPPGMQAIANILFYDPKAPEKDPREATYDELPYGILFPGGNEVYMCTGFGANDTRAGFRSAPAFTKSAHGDYDVNTFVIYRKGNLSPDTGIYDVYTGQRSYYGYQKKTVAHNDILIIDPTRPDEPIKPGPGGTEKVKPKTFGSPSYTNPDMIFLHNPYGEWGDIVAFETTPYYDYAVGEAAKAYYTRLDEYYRSIVFIRKGTKAYFIVFDRVNAKQDNYIKKWLMHFVTEPQVSGNKVSEEVPGHIDTYDGDFIYAENVYGTAAIYVKTLLPEDHLIRRVGGEGYEFYVEGTNPTNYPVDQYDLDRVSGQMDGPWQEAGTWRIELMPSERRKRDLFLNVMYIGDVNETMAPVERIEEGGRVGALIQDPEMTVKLLFNKEGEPGGHITIIKNGITVVDKEFAGGVEPPPEPLNIITPSLPSGTARTSYTYILSATGGTSPYTWSLDSGSLPDGLSLNDNGVISGTPTAAGTYSFTVRVTDSAVPTPNTATKQFSITINPGDTDPPAVVTSLTASPGAEPGTVVLTWTAPGDDGMSGTASSYDIRYSTSPITEENWAQATQCEGEPRPQPAGSTETFKVTGLTPGVTYYFALKTSDEVPNVSALSNVASAVAAQEEPQDTIPPTIKSVIPRSSRTVQIVFSESVDRTSAENISNYTINNGIEVRGASLKDSTTVYLATDDHAQGTTYTLRVSNIRDLSGNTIEPNTSKSYTFDPVMIWLEAEEGALTPPMQAASDSSASGGSYIHAPSGGYRDGRAEYTVEIPQDGDYIIWGRVLAPDVGRNSFFVSFDEDQDDIWDCLYEGQSQDWTWDQVTWRGNGSYDAPQFDPVVFHLNSGTHTLIIKERESGTKLDKILLTNDFSFVPTDAHRDTIPPAPPTGLKVTWH